MIVLLHPGGTQESSVTSHFVLQFSFASIFLFNGGKTPSPHCHSPLPILLLLEGLSTVLWLYNFIGMLKNSFCDQSYFIVLKHLFFPWQWGLLTAICFPLTSAPPIPLPSWTMLMNFLSRNHQSSLCDQFIEFYIFLLSGSDASRITVIWPLPFFNFFFSNSLGGILWLYFIQESPKQHLTGSLKNFICQFHCIGDCHITVIPPSLSFHHVITFCDNSDGTLWLFHSGIAQAASVTGPLSCFVCSFLGSKASHVSAILSSLFSHLTFCNKLDGILWMYFVQEMPKLPMWLAQLTI